MMTDYNDFTNEQLIERIHQLEAELLEAKRGYIYVLQFEKDKDEGIFKAGKTGDNIENRFANYRTMFGDELGLLEVKRVGAVKDSLAAEQMMHELIRKSGVQSINDSSRNKKSTIKSEWYIDRDMELIETAFEKTMNEYGMDDDDIVRKYDSYAKDALDEALVAISRYKDWMLQKGKYFFNPSTKKVYKKTMHGLDVMNVQKGTGKYGMSKEGKGSCQVSLEYIVSVYGQ